MLPAAMPPAFPQMMPGMAGMKPPTEDVHKTFNAEAPVFVPRAAAPAPEVAAAQEAEESVGGVAEAVAKAAAPPPSGGGPPGLEPLGAPAMEKEHAEESAPADAQE